MTFLNKLYGEWNKIDDSVIVLASYERLDDEDNVESIFENNNNINNN